MMATSQSLRRSFIGIAFTLYFKRTRRCKEFMLSVVRYLPKQQILLGVFRVQELQEVLEPELILEERVKIHRPAVRFNRL